ncbi:MAG: hypothetical protein AAFW76_08955 [Pseudomonadota bacterium]
MSIEPDSPAPFQARQPYWLVGTVGLFVGLGVGHTIGALVHTGWQFGAPLATEIRTALMIALFPEALGWLFAILLLGRGRFANRGALVLRFVQIASLLALGHYLLIIFTIGAMGHDSLGPWFADSIRTFVGYALYAATVIVPAAVTFSLICLTPRQNSQPS